MCKYENALLFYLSQIKDTYSNLPKKPNVSEANYLGNNRNSAARYTDRTVHVS